MAQMRFPDRVDRVCKLLDIAEAAHARGVVVAAIEAYVGAEELIRELIEDDPDEPTHVQSLGSALYAAGELRLAHGDALGAVNTLRRAEQAYLALRRFDPAPTMLPRLIADVRLRRARGLVMLDRAPSALVDAQAAVLAAIMKTPSKHGNV